MNLSLPKVTINNEFVKDSEIQENPQASDCTHLKSVYWYVICTHVLFPIIELHAPSLDSVKIALRPSRGRLMTIIYRLQPALRLDIEMR